MGLTSSFDWASSENKIICLFILWVVVFGVRSNSSSSEKFSDYQGKVVVLIFSKLIDADICS